MSEALSGAPAGEGAAVEAPSTPSAGQPGVAPQAAPTRAPGPGDATETIQKGRKSGERADLPGVFRRETGEDSDLGRPSRRRDASGRFAAGSIEAEMEADGRAEAGAADDAEASGKPGELAAPVPTKKAAPELPPGVAEQKPATGKYRFAGGEFASQEHAEQTFRSLRGMFKPLKEVLGENPGEWEGRVGQLKQAGEVHKAYTAWKADAEQHRARNAELEQENARLRSGGATPGASPAGQPNAGSATPASSSSDLPDLNTILNKIDTDAFELIAAQSGLPHAGKYLVGETLKAVLSDIVPALRAQHEQALQPFQNEAARRQVAQQVGDVFSQVQSLRDNSGEQAFPELNDPETAAAIGRLWIESGLPAEAAMTPQGVLHAVAMYRMANGYATPQRTPAAPATQPAPATSRPAPAAAASITAEPASLPSNQGRSALPATLANFVRSLDRGAVIDRDLGFTRRRR